MRGCEDKTSIDPFINYRWEVTIDSKLAGTTMWTISFGRSVCSEKSWCGLDVSNSSLCSSSGESWTADDAAT